MQKTLYPIREIKPIKTGHFSGYNIQFELPNGKTATVTLRDDHPSWGYIKRIKRDVKPEILIGTFNHDWLHFQTHLHMVHAVTLPDHSEQTQMTIPLRDPCHIEPIDASNHRQLNLHFPFMNHDGSSHKLQLRPEDLKKGLVHFVDELDCPEIDIEIVIANPLQWGMVDFDLRAVRLPNRFQHYFLPST